MRETTNELIDKVWSGELTWKQVALAALMYMSEEQVQAMAERANWQGLLDEETETVMIKTGVQQ